MHSLKFFVAPVAAIALWAFMTANVIAQFESFAKATEKAPRLEQKVGAPQHLVAAR